MIKPNLILGDCLEQMAAMPDNSVDSIVTDPPYGLSFMGKKWDYDVPSVEIWQQALRVLKPGGHLLAFAGTRTQHRMAVRIEDAGFEIRDMIAWVYGSGFPKSLDVSKAIDKAAGVEGSFGAPKSTAHAGWIERGRMRGDEGHAGYQRPWMGDAEAVDKNARQYIGGTEAARQWQGWGTALKPALEPITVARKPLIGTVAANVLAHGTGAINVDGCRVGTDTVGWGGKGRNSDSATAGASRGGTQGGYNYTGGEARPTNGRWPANLIHDGSEEVLAEFPDSGAGNGKGAYSYAGTEYHNKDTSMFNGDKPQAPSNFNDSGSAARFFYCAKASKKDRDDGLSSMPTVTADSYGQHRGRRMEDNDARFDGKPAAQGKNNHPTVKPTALMRYLCRLVTPPGGIVLDPFMGSGSTGKAAVLEGFDFIGIELNPEYFAIAEKRIPQKQV